MITSIRAEIRKLRYQRSTYGILASAAALAAVSSMSIVASAGNARRQAFINLTQESTMHLVMGAAAAGYLFSLILGIVTSSGEYRHSTAVATYLAQPDRRVVLLAKMVVAGVAGAVLQLVSTSFGMTAATLYANRFPHFALESDAYLRILAGAVLVGAVLGVVGTAVGTLIRSQQVAIVVAILWLQLVEGLVLVFADWLGKWSMRGAITSVLDIAVRVRTPQATIDTTDILGPWQSVALLLGYATLFTVLAMRTSMRRDVD